MADRPAAVPPAHPSPPLTPQRRSNTEGADSTGITTAQPPNVGIPANKGWSWQARGAGPTRTPTSPNLSTIRPERRPPAPRRASSRMVPIKGVVFSAEDDSQDLDEDEQQEMMTLRRQQSSTLRRHPSTTRRRLPPRMPSRLLQAEEDDDVESPTSAGAPPEPVTPVKPGLVPEQLSPEQDEIMDDVDDDADTSDAESFTLKDRQEAINDTHPFGIRIWKSALYKKNRSVEKGAEGDIHSAPGGKISGWLWFFNAAWTIIFGWWLALFAFAGSLVCLLFGFAPGCHEYGQVLWGLARYLLFPFGKYVKLVQDETYAEEDEGEGRSISEYEQWQSGDIEQGRLFFGPVRTLLGHPSDAPPSPAPAENAALLGPQESNESGANGKSKIKRRLFGRGQWNTGRVIFFIFFYGILTPFLLLVSCACWFMIFTLPMARVTFLVWNHLRRHPLALEFHSDTTDIRVSGAIPSAILVCTYRAVGLKYWKYTIDGTNIILFNLLALVGFTIIDYFVLFEALGLRIPLTNTVFVFLLGLFSIIPLAYFIGQAVASISAQSSMGVGAAVNAFFSTIVEVFLYCVALRQGKAQLVEGSVIGSIFAGILLLPGISMCFGAIKRKTQRFNVKSAGVTSTMLLFAVIGVFGPTLFYQIYGSHELNCDDCSDTIGNPQDRDCRRCYFMQIPAVHDTFYRQAVRPFIWFAAALLFCSYVVGLLFTLRTHAATIWNAEIDEKKERKPSLIEQTPNGELPGQGAGSKTSGIDYGTAQGSGHGPHGMYGTLSRTNTRTDIRESQLYRRILGQSLKQVGLVPQGSDSAEQRKVSGLDGTSASSNTPAATAEDEAAKKKPPSLRLHNLSEEENQSLFRQMAEMAATAAAVAARDATTAPKKISVMSRTISSTVVPPESQHLAPQEAPASATGSTHAPVASGNHPEEAVLSGEASSGGHDAPNWSRTKSYFVLLTATIAYAIIAEILVDTVDAVLANSDIDEKFLGITLFALVPNTTEFLNGISFAMNGNIALSLEIGSAYALQVCLLQIPALVLFSAVNGQFIDPLDVIDHTFTLIFPQWDMVTVILCVFLLSYMYGEGKSNYFKGSILILSYLVVIMGFYMAGFSNIVAEDPDDPAGAKRPVTYQTRYKTMAGPRPIVMQQRRI